MFAPDTSDDKPFLRLYDPADGLHLVRNASPIEREPGQNASPVKKAGAGNASPVEDARAAKAVDEWEYRERDSKLAPGFGRWNALRLARELRAGGSPFEDVWGACLEHACGRRRINAKKFRQFMVEAWDLAGSGMTRWEEAAQRADESVARFRVKGRKEHDARAAALAYQLAGLGDGGWFPFGSRPLAEWLGVHRETADRIVKRLERTGLIEVRKDEKGKTAYRYKGGDSRQIRWRG